MDDAARAKLPDCWGLDLGEKCGYAHAPPGTPPKDVKSGVVHFKGKDIDDKWAEFRIWLCKNFVSCPPQGVGVEKMPTPTAMKRGMNMGDASIVSEIGYHVILRVVCRELGIPLYEVASDKMRKHFMNMGRTGTRAGTKAAMVKMSKLLGYMPKDAKDDNQADACGVFDWLTATHYRQMDLFRQQLAKS